MRYLPRILLGLFMVFVSLIAFTGGIGAIQLSWKYFWPFAILIPGVSFELAYFSRKNKEFSPSAGFLIPGGIIITIAVLMFICSINDFKPMPYLWPVFILAPAAGLFQLYIFGSGNRGVLLACMILTAIASVFLTFSLISIPVVSFIFPAILVLYGIYLVFWDKKYYKKTKDRN